VHVLLAHPGDEEDLVVHRQAEQDAEQPIELSPTEFRLLRFLMLRQGRIVTREQLLERVWNYDFGGNDTVVATYISYLRKKVDALGTPLIHTQRGVGYRIGEDCCAGNAVCDGGNAICGGGAASRCASGCPRCCSWSS
jgi:DNA-binding winged helix-turn-helix (wHTH) protein